MPANVSSSTAIALSKPRTRRASRSSACRDRNEGFEAEGRHIAIELVQQRGQRLSHLAGTKFSRELEVAGPAKKPRTDALAHPPSVYTRRKQPLWYGPHLLA